MPKLAKWPIYFTDNLVQGNPKSEAAIVTLWTPVKNITDKIDSSLFCLAGQLYSKDGVNYILRNILANPKIRYIIVCGRELSESGKALVNFFEKGIDEDYRIIGVESAQIDREISKEAMELIRREIKIENLIGISDAGKILEKLKNYQVIGEPFSEPLVFPEPKKDESQSFPSEESVYTIRNKYIGPAWLEALKLIEKFGSIRDTFYGTRTRGVFGIAAVISEEDSFDPKIFPYMRVSKEEIENYCKYIMSGDKGEEPYSYGQRLWNYKGINQIEEAIIAPLKIDPSDRATLAVIFDFTVDHKAHRLNRPCMCIVHAVVSNGKLNLTAYFRSHSILSGWVLNAFGLRCLQKYIADKTDYPMGTLTIFSNCVHIYENEWKIMEDIVKNYGDNYECFLDPRGYFLISIEEKEIIAKHYSPDGKFLKEYKQDGTVAKPAMAMYNQLLRDNAVSQTAHAFDVGAELQKAEIAVKNGLKYAQDKELVLRD